MKRVAAGARSHDVVALGEAVVDLFAPPGVGLSQADDFRLWPGGAPANVAAGVAKLGGRAAFIGVVGEDPFGRRLRDALRGVGVDISGLRSTREARTTLAWVAKPSADVSEFLFYRNADALLTCGPEDLERVRRARVLHVGSVSLSAEPARSSTLAAIEASRKAEVIVSFDPNWRPDLWDDVAEGTALIRRVASLCDVVKMNEQEAELIVSAHEPAEAVRRLLEMGPSLAFVTSGSRGAAFASPNAAGSLPAPSVDVVDTTGSGDAFAAALLVGLVEAGAHRRDLSAMDLSALCDLARSANAAGALAATRYGTIPALPTRDELSTLLTM